MASKLLLEKSHTRNRMEEGEPTLCARELCGTCDIAPDPPRHIHHDLPYLWQVHQYNAGWVSLQADTNISLEQAFAMPNCCSRDVQVHITYSDGKTSTPTLHVDFGQMLATMTHAVMHQDEQALMAVRRLSTPSYAQWGPLTTPNKASPGRKEGEPRQAADSRGSSVCQVGYLEGEPVPSCCPWRWYYNDDCNWKLFEKDGVSPLQYVLESKYLAKQKVYRFDVGSPPVTYLLNMEAMELLNLSNGKVTSIRRRPLFVGPSYVACRKFPTIPSVKPLPYTMTIPDRWFPLDYKSDYELVPLDPNSFEYHLVASEVIKPSKRPWTILDIYRLQNPYLWHKYHSKKLYMGQQGGPTNERLLFHGTYDPQRIQAILHHNFDCRLSGRNATHFGEGVYFARSPSYSDRYTGGANADQRWMFLARVLVGRAVRGERGLKRPPPLDPNQPHGALYDSCVDDLYFPKIHVVFDNDQCYPDFLICYKK